MRNAIPIIWPADIAPIQAPGRSGLLWDAAIMEVLYRVYDFVMQLREVASIADPFAFTLNLWNCRDYSLQRSKTWPEDNLFLPLVIVGSDESMDTGLRRIADLFWNAFGVERAPFFDAEGNLKLPQ